MFHECEHNLPKSCHNTIFYPVVCCTYTYLFCNELSQFISANKSITVINNSQKCQYYTYIQVHVRKYLSNFQSFWLSSSLFASTQSIQNSKKLHTCSIEIYIYMMDIKQVYSKIMPEKNVWEYNNGSVRPGKDFFGMSAARDVYWNVKEKNQPQN